MLVPYRVATLLVPPLVFGLKEMTMSKKSGGKLRGGKSVKSQKSLRLAVNHNEIVLRG
jgi:hypothetical protein